MTGRKTPMPIVHLEGIGDEAEQRREYPAFPVEIGALRFSVDEADRAEWLVATNVFSAFGTRVPSGRRILVVREPSAGYPAEFINQFGVLLSPKAIPGYRGRWHQGHAAHSPFFGIDFSGGCARSRPDFGALMAMRPPEKRSAISAVVSKKSILPGHRRRLEFLRRLKVALGTRLNIFGNGFAEIADKADAILPYQYHLVLENTSMPGYWTEKLVDAYLGYSFPIVSGAPDLERWFPVDSFERIDLDDIDASVETVLRILASDAFEKRRGLIEQARDRMMREERLCHVIARIIAADPDSSPQLTQPEIILAVPRPAILALAKREIARAWWRAEVWTRSR